MVLEVFPPEHIYSLALMKPGCIDSQGMMYNITFASIFRRERLRILGLPDRQVLIWNVYLQLSNILTFTGHVSWKFETRRLFLLYRLFHGSEFYFLTVLWVK